MKTPIILLFSGLFFLLLGGVLFWQEILDYRIFKEQGERKQWWINELINYILFSFSYGILGAISCFLFGVLLVVLAIIGFNHGLAFQNS